MSDEDLGAVGDVPLADRPDPIDIEITEPTNSKLCTIRYKYPAMKEDEVLWTLEVSDGGGFYIRFEVKRGNKVIALHKSKTITGPKENLVCKKQKLKEGKHYEVQLEKKTDFRLEDKFRPDSPA